MTMLLLYVRLFERQKSNSSQQSSADFSQNETQFKQDTHTRNAHQKTVEHLHQVKTNYSLERRFF